MSEEFGFDDVDAYHNERDLLLLKRAGRRGRHQHDSDEDSEVDVMGISEGEDSEEEEEEDRDDEKFGFEKKMLDSEDEEYFKGEEEEEEEEDEGWGRHKDNYYGGDEIDENDPEVAKQMEEEALRQQKKHLSELNMDDYIDEDMMDDWSKSKDSAENTTSILVLEAPLQDISSLSQEERLNLLKQNHAEFIPLIKELSVLKPQLDLLSKQKDENEVYQVKFTSLSAYLGSITTYLALFLSNLEAEDSKFTMKDHPVMESILMTRECWRQANELPEDIEMASVESELSDQEISSIKSSVSLSEDEDEEFDSDLDSEKETPVADDKLNIDYNTKRNIKKLAKKRADEIDDVDAEEKRSRRRTLRFYTSKIDQVEKKKDVKFGGDEDIPYKERLYERQQRLIEEARKRGTKEHGAGVDLDDEDFNSDDEKAARDINDDNDYYNSLKNAKKDAKDGRMSAHRDAVKAAKEGKLLELQEDIDDNGKRALNYQIMKNKGLTPHRNKDNRNSRVKKRKKYEKAQKKLKSVRAVYSGQQGPYSGEKTGIKKGLSKSVKLV